METTIPQNSGRLPWRQSNEAGIEHVIADLAKPTNFQSGAFFVLRHVDNQEGMWKRIEAFEDTKTVGDKVVRRWDARTTDGGIIQFKTWASFDKRTFVRQLFEDLRETGGDLSKIEWVFDTENNVSTDAIERLAKAALDDDALVAKYANPKQRDLIKRVGSESIVAQIISYGAFSG